MGHDSELARQELQLAMQNSVSQDLGVRPMVGPEGPFAPAGLLNSGNSCFWNALVQALFFSVPQFRSALFQLDLEKSLAAQEVEVEEVLQLMRDLFVEMDMGMTGAIDASKLYKAIFQQPEEADVSEQLQYFLELCSKAAPLKAVCQDLFEGQLHELLEERGERQWRRVPLDFFQLDLCVTKPSLVELLEEHMQDVQGSIVRKKYTLPQVLWLNLSRFRYDVRAQRGKKRPLRLSFPDRLHAYLLAEGMGKEEMEEEMGEMGEIGRKGDSQDGEEGEEWKGFQALLLERRRLQAELSSNREALKLCSQSCVSKHQALPEEDLLRIAERQEELLKSMDSLEQELMLYGMERGLVYELRSVIVHRGVLDSGHYFAFARHSSS